MLEKFAVAGVIYFLIDFCDGEDIVDAYAVVTADLQHEHESEDCPASWTYKVHPELTVHYERTSAQIDPALLSQCEFIISSYTYDSSRSHQRCEWTNKTYKTLSELIDKNQSSIEWDQNSI
jgi:hypothetical protein